MAFQTQAALRNHAGLPGGFASDNVYYAGALRAGAGGVEVGLFASVTPGTGAWDAEAPANPSIAVNGGANAVGIVWRARIGTLDPTKENFVNRIPENFPVEIVMWGDARVSLGNYSAATIGMKLFYCPADVVGTGSAEAPQYPAGSVQAAAAGGSVTDFVETDWYVYSKDEFDGDGMVKVSTIRKS